MRAAMAAVMAGVMAACGGGGGQAGLVQVADTCPGTLPCAVEVPHGYVADAGFVASTLRGVVAAGCARFSAECAYLCEQPFVTCAPTAAQCTEETTKDYLEDYEHPVIDPTLAARCRADIGAAACVDIPPDTPACELALVEGCPGDLDNLGAPYSWHAAAGLAVVPAEVQVHLCDGVSEWVSVQLRKGDRVQLSAREAEPSFGRVRATLHIDHEPGKAPSYLTSETMAWAGEEAAEIDPVDVDGRYLLELSLSGAPAVDLTLLVEVVAP